MQIHTKKFKKQNKTNKNEKTKNRIFFKEKKNIFLYKTNKLKKN